MEILGATKIPENPHKKYFCQCCYYSTSHLGDWNKHISTAKHIRTTMTTSGSHICQCGKVYANRQNLYRHKKTCIYSENVTPLSEKIPKLLPFAPKQTNCECGATFSRINNLKRHQKSCKFIKYSTPETASSRDNSEVVKMFGSLNAKLDETTAKLDKSCEDNKLLKEKLNQIESGVMTAVSEPKIVNHNYNNNIIFLLNEKCSEAVAITEFANQIALCMEDVNYAMENGKVKGIENIIRKKFEELGTYKRPLHCTDVKRGTLYVKNEEGWEKEKGEINQMIRDVECVQTSGITVWSDANPTYSLGNTRLMDKWLRIVQCLTGSIEGVGMRKIEKRCKEMSKIDQKVIE
tara:strand:- start:126 stop:1172 length:1047 start_codon:yes stop_codon:yes gene_type:complete